MSQIAEIYAPSSASEVDYPPTPDNVFFEPDTSPDTPTFTPDSHSQDTSPDPETEQPKTFVTTYKRVDGAWCMIKEDGSIDKPLQTNPSPEVQAIIDRLISPGDSETTEFLSEDESTETCQVIVVVTYSINTEGNLVATSNLDRREVEPNQSEEDPTDDDAPSDGGTTQARVTQKDDLAPKEPSFIGHDHQSASLGNEAVDMAQLSPSRLTKPISSSEDKLSPAMPEPDVVPMTQTADNQPVNNARDQVNHTEHAPSTEIDTRPNDYPLPEKSLTTEDQQVPPLPLERPTIEAKDSATAETFDTNEIIPVAELPIAYQDIDIRVVNPSDKDTSLFETGKPIAGPPGEDSDIEIFVISPPEETPGRDSPPGPIENDSSDNPPDIFLVEFDNSPPFDRELSLPVDVHPFETSTSFGIKAEDIAENILDANTDSVTGHLYTPVALAENSQTVDTVKVPKSIEAIDDEIELSPAIDNRQLSQPTVAPDNLARAEVALPKTTPPMVESLEVDLRKNEPVPLDIAPLDHAVASEVAAPEISDISMSPQERSIETRISSTPTGISYDYTLNNPTEKTSPITAQPDREVQPNTHRQAKHASSTSTPMLDWDEVMKTNFGQPPAKATGDLVFTATVTKRRTPPNSNRQSEHAKAIA